MLRSCCRSCTTRNDKTPKESTRSSNWSGDTSVNKEYKKVFRSISYMKIHDKVQREVVRTGDRTTSSLRSLRFHFSMNLLETQQEIINCMMESRNLHPFLVDFFEATLRACRECEAILRSVYKTRLNYKKIQEAIKIAQRLDVGRRTVKPNLLIQKELVGFAKQENPLQAISATQFDDIRDHCTTLYQKLKSKHKKVKRKRKFIRLLKRVGKWGLVASCTAIAVAVVIGAVHSTAGIVTVPVSVACILVLLLGVGGKSTTRESERTNPHDRLKQLDQAAKGIFVLSSDLDTVNSLLRRLHGEVDRIKAIVDICTGDMSNGRLKVVVRELEVHDSNFMDQVKELEEHIHLCFLDLNWSIRPVMHVTMNV